MIRSPFCALSRIYSLFCFVSRNLTFATIHLNKIQSVMLALVTNAKALFFGLLILQDEATFRVSSDKRHLENRKIGMTVAKK